MQTFDSYRRLLRARDWKDPAGAVLVLVHPPAGAPSSRRFRTGTDEGDGSTVPPLTSVLASDDALVAPLVKRERSPYEEFIFVGRSVTADIVLEDESISKSHAAFQRCKEEWFVKDVRSHNGTYVDGERVEAGERVKLRSGAQVTFGAVAAYFVELPYLRHLVVE